MRIVSLFDGIFWGLFFIVIGVWFMVRRYVPVQIPILRVVFAVLFVWIGIRILIAGPEIREKNTVVFSEARLEAQADDSRDDYNVIFSTATIDLTQLAPAGSTIRKTVNIVFGSGILRINPNVPVRIELATAFGSVQTPDGRSIVFGDKEYRTPAYKDGGDAVVIKASAVFGSLRIQE
jgi:predicted membrane protein